MKRRQMGLEGRGALKPGRGYGVCALSREAMVLGSDPHCVPESFLPSTFPGLCAPLPCHSPVTCVLFVSETSSE